MTESKKLDIISKYNSLVDGIDTRSHSLTIGQYEALVRHIEQGWQIIIPSKDRRK